MTEIPALSPSEVLDSLQKSLEDRNRVADEQSVDFWISWLEIHTAMLRESQGNDSST